MPRFRTSILWLAAIFVVAGSALGFAQGGESDDPTTEPPEVESSEPAAEDEAGKPAKIKASEQPEDASGERKQNHGFFVSTAAHCEDVDDPDTAEDPDFSAPEDCTGSAHGAYVSSVAKSSIGKKDKAEGNNSQGS